METICRTESGTFQIHWIKTDRFFCERCLEQKATTTDEWSREKPDWY